MEDLDWRLLVRNIAKGNCILVLGPDLAREKVGSAYKSLSEILSNQLAESLEKETVLNPEDLFSTAQQYADANSEGKLRLAVEDFYKSRKTEAGSVYAELAHLPFQLIVNATPDRLLIQALEKTSKEYAEAFYNYHGEPHEMVVWESRKKPLVYYLYGSVEEPRSLVISEKDLLEFLVAVTTKDPTIPNNILSEFRDNGKSFLFLGFGFRNWYLRILLYVLLDGKANKIEKENQSFALEEATAKSSPEFQQVSFLFGENLKLNFADTSVEEFVKELRKRFDAEVKPEDLNTNNGSSTKKTSKPVAPESEPVVAEPVAGSPTVFICHASENKEVAHKIWEKLKEGGLNPWIDKEGIRGGDQWDQLLEKQIKDVNYIVVVQSKALADKAKQKSYVNKEITLSLEERKQFPAQINFIFPVKIEECESRAEFSDWQTTDLTDFNNIENLLKDIRRDWARRKK